MKKFLFIALVFVPSLALAIGGYAGGRIGGGALDTGNSAANDLYGSIGVFSGHVGMSFGEQFTLGVNLGSSFAFGESDDGLIDHTLRITPVMIEFSFYPMDRFSGVYVGGGIGTARVTESIDNFLVSSLEVSESGTAFDLHVGWNFELGRGVHTLGPEVRYFQVDLDANDVSYIGALAVYNFWWN